MFARSLLCTWTSLHLNIKQEFPPLPHHPLHKEIDFKYDHQVLCSLKRHDFQVLPKRHGRRQRKGKEWVPYQKCCQVSSDLKQVTHSNTFKRGISVCNIYYESQTVTFVFEIKWGFHRMFYMQNLFNQGKPTPIAGNKSHIIRSHLILTKVHKKHSDNKCIYTRLTQA